VNITVRICDIQDDCFWRLAVIRSRRIERPEL